MELNQYLSIFLEESKDHLQALNQNLLSLENNPQDTGLVQHIFRSAHTLKGMSATMGFEDMASLTHEMENVLDLLRNKKLEMNPFISDTLFKSLDALESMVLDITNGGLGISDVKQIILSLNSVVSGDNEKQSKPFIKQEISSPIHLDQYQFSVMQQASEAEQNIFYLEVSVREDCILKAARAYMVFNLLEAYGEVVKSFPSVEDIEREKFDIKFNLYYISKQNEIALEKMILNVSEIHSVQIIPVDLESLRQMLNEVAVSKEAPVAVMENNILPLTQNTQSITVPVNVQVSNRTIRVDIERLDTLMNLFSELLIDRVRLEQLASEIRKPELTETVEHITRVSSDLQNIVLKLRMVPVDSVFNRFPRMIRDLAKSLGKKVDLIITGADTELDRIVVDEIGDPLVHLLRNALDHGIEPVKDRIILNKPETGTIHLRAFHSGNHVFIEIEEDGRGINCNKVLQMALTNGIITQDEAKKMPEEDIYQLLFASGFSTADKISDISGRGVGLDVVKTKIMSLGGHVTVHSKLGSGTKFSVQLPLTLSIISAMLVKVGTEKYAIPLTSIVETSVIQQEQIHHVHGTKMIDYRNSLIPIISLRTLFDCPFLEEDAEMNEKEIVVIRKSEKMIALIVDEFIGQQETVIKTLGKYFTNLYAISGATILGDGQVALIIDPNAIIK